MIYWLENKIPVSLNNCKNGLNQQKLAILTASKKYEAMRPLIYCE